VQRAFAVRYTAATREEENGGVVVVVGGGGGQRGVMRKPAGSLGPPSIPLCYPGSALVYGGGERPILHRPPPPLRLSRARARLPVDQYGA